MTAVKRALGKDGTQEEAEVEHNGEQKELPQLCPKEDTSHMSWDNLMIRSLANFLAITSPEYFNIHSYYTLTIKKEKFD